MTAILDLPTEILALIFLYASAAALTRQKRRLLLLKLGSVCKAFSAICLRQNYAKLAYEISEKGAKLLSTFEGSDRYARLVRALAIREREGAVQRSVVNSRALDALSGLPTRARKTALEAVTFEEKRITQLLRILQRNLIELKWESNLLPDTDSSFSELSKLQSFICIPQPPFPADADHQALVQTATFTLRLPPSLFLTAFCQLRYLNHLDLWKCSFADFDSQLHMASIPHMNLSTLVLQECTISADVLDWLVKASIAAASLRTLKIGFLIDSNTESSNPLDEGIKRLIQHSAASLLNLAYDGDEGDLQPNLQSDEEDALEVVPSPFSCLKRLKSLHLGGRAITSHHWMGISSPLFENLKSLELEYTPLLPPSDVLKTLKTIPSASHVLKIVCLKGAEDSRRRNTRELLRPAEPSTNWYWNRMEFVSLTSLLDARGTSYVADRAIAVGNGDEDDQPSSDGDDFDMGEYDEGDFFVTPEQWAEERRIETEELERTWESGSEY